MKFNTSNTFKDVGFLSPEIKPIIADLRKLHATWFVSAEDVDRTGQRILAGFQPSGSAAVRDVVAIALLMPLGYHAHQTEDGPSRTMTALPRVPAPANLDALAVYRTVARRARCSRGG
jgi:hypothetical protein